MIQNTELIIPGKSPVQLFSTRVPFNSEIQANFAVCIPEEGKNRPLFKKSFSLEKDVFFTLIK